MKTLRLFTIVLLAVLVISTWGPAPAYAKSADTAPTNSTSLTVDLAKTKLARLRVNNKTGGTLYVSFAGERSYNFSTSSQGKTTFDAVIQPGKYTVTVTTSACKGKLSFKRNVKGGTVGLPGFSCKRK
ncbi:MAG: hypothetical protein EHM33_22490 [Chloroflexi bacterium]|nr:MAG: hypothetical protein EHM33_22490 [Chloroflexota bacterium]